jgi:hypothetical protein
MQKAEGSVRDGGLTDAIEASFTRLYFLLKYIQFFSLFDSFIGRPNQHY